MEKVKNIWQNITVLIPLLQLDGHYKLGNGNVELAQYITKIHRLFAYFFSFFKMGDSRPFYLFFTFSHDTIDKSVGLKPGAAGWKAQMHPLRNGGNPLINFLPLTF